MPALPSVPAVVRNVLHFTLEEDLHAIVRFFIKYSGSAPSDADMVTYATAIGTAFDDNLASLMSTQYHCIECISTDLSSPTAAEGAGTFDSPGTRSGTTIPASLCLLEKLHVARRYRGGHPRTYWPFGVAADQEDAQTWDSSFLTAAATALSAWDAALTALDIGSATTVSQVNVSYYNGFTVHTGVTGRARNVPTVRSSPVIDTITAASVATGMASQRRRLLRLA